MSTTEPPITVRAEDLTMTFRVPIRPPGLRAAMSSLVSRRYREVHAIRRATFDLSAGEVTGFLGPNGAGKTTTMKILSGLLHPTAGSVEVLGHTPWHRRRAFLRRIALIRGSQPVGGSQELTVSDSLQYQRLLYEIDAGEFRAGLRMFAELLELDPLLDRQLRALSLGEKMRAGLALGLIYRPEVLFLDEPTLGLDVAAAAAIREFVGEYARRTGATVLLTSHHMLDVESLCARVMLIDHGLVRYDGGLADLSARMSPDKLIRVTTAEPVPSDLAANGSLVEADAASWTIRVPRPQVAGTATRLLTELPVTDLTVEEPSLDTVMHRAYRDSDDALDRIT